MVDIFDAVADVGPVFPHSEERKIPNRACFVFQAVSVRQDLNLNNGPFSNIYVIERLEYAIFEFSRDGHLGAQESIVNRTLENSTARTL